MKNYYPIENEKYCDSQIIIKSPDILHRVDFELDEKAAKEWANAHRERLEKELTPIEKNSINRLHNPSFVEDYNINRTLKETGGDVNSLPKNDDNGNLDEDLLDIIERYEDDIANISKSLERLSSRLPGRMYVYKEMGFSDFGYLNTDFLDYTNDNFNIQKLIDFEKKFQYGHFSEFLPVKAFYREMHTNREDRIQLRIELPKGTSVLPIGGDSDTLYLAQSSGVKVQDMKITLLNGKEHLIIDAIYIEKQDVEDIITSQIKFKEDANNINWNAELNLPITTKQIEFNFKDSFASGMVYYAEKAINELLSIKSTNIHNFLMDTSNYLSEENGKIIFTDSLLGYIKELQLGYKLSEKNIELWNESSGLTNQRYRYIGITDRSIDIDSQTIFKDYERMNDTLLHELTHVKDRILNIKYYDSGFLFSAKNDEKNGFFLNVYNEDKKNLTEPFFKFAVSRPREYLAEIHSYMYSNRIYPGTELELKGRSLKEIVHEKVPNTIKWIEKFLYQ